MFDDSGIEFDSMICLMGKKIKCLKSNVSASYEGLKNNDLINNKS